jgi:hypothetical protein
MKHSAYLAALSAVLLAACGGGGSSDPAPVTAPATVAAVASFGACFELTPGVKFIQSNGFKKLVVQEVFEGSSAFGRADLRSDDTRMYVNYQAISGGFVHMLGVNEYDDKGVSDGKQVFSSSDQISVDLAAGQTAQLNYTETRTSNYAPTSTTSRTESVTFVGFENLTLGGRVFADTCKFTAPASVAGQTNVTWLAKGFGAIRSEKQDAQRVLVAGSRIELTTIVSAP